jgi:ADP-ribosyl-[dinitrogen reductase] hydrolase
MSEIKNKILGLFIGQLIGDALGTRYEFLKINEVKETIIDDTDQYKNPLKILGGGPFYLSAGNFTDDSELALGIWYSMLTKDRYDITDISNVFYKWFNSKPFDIGRATRNAFENGSTYVKMKNNATVSNKFSLSNGCLMKISPVGIVGILGYSNDIKKCAKEVCELTNPHPLCIDMCVAYVVAIQEAIISGDPIKAYLKAKTTATHSLTKELLNDALYKNNPVKKMKNMDNEKEGYEEVVTDGAYMGYIGIAFQNAFYQLLHREPNKNGFYDCLVDTIMLGGDTDTNACIAGALYGACYGIKKMPKDWLNAVHTSYSERHKVFKQCDNNFVYNLLKKKINK